MLSTNSFNKFNTRACAVALCLITAVCGLVAQAGEQMVNPELAKRMEIYQPNLQRVGERVHAVIGYEYSNYAYIEGDDGIIVVDSGWFPGQAARSIADYREKVSDKPIAAIIYTHSHLDHTNGASGIMRGQNPDIPVYGAKGFERWVDESFSVYRPAIFRRIFMQMGLVLPRGETGTVGNGLNPSPVPEGKSELSFPPTAAIEDATELTIAGVRIQLIPQQGDIPENLYVWLPDDKVLFVGDIPLHATFPAIETVRFEAARDPREHIGSLNKILELDPDHIVPGHGRVLSGRADVQDVTLANRDTVEFMIDQVDRYYINGYSADQMIDRLELPPKLAAHPDLQPFYHRVEWMLKTMYFKRAGFVGETMDYLTLTNHQEAKRLVPLLGGVEKVQQQAREALNNDDPRWAARLATYVLEVEPHNEPAKMLRQQAFTRVARTTESANERNYLLSAIREENGELEWKKIFSAGDYDIIRQQETDTVLSLMKARMRAEKANDLAFVVKLVIDKENPRLLRVRNNVLILEQGSAAAVDAEMSMSRDTLDKLAANLLDWPTALNAGNIKVAQGRSTVEKLVKLIE